MITIPRCVARSCRAVFRRLLTGRTPRGRPLAIGLSCGPGGLRVRFAAAEAAVEYHHPSPGADARLAVPLDALAACEGRRGDAVFRPPDGGRVEVVFSEGGASSVRPFACDGLDAPPFPDWPESDTTNDPRLLVALDRAMQTAAKEGARYALHRVLLRGKKGEVVATDGSQLLIEGGFTFPWEVDLLVPRVTVFAAPELAGVRSVRVSLSGGHVLFRAGDWTVALKVTEGERYPNVEAAIPTSRSATVWRPGPGEVEELARLLPGLPGGGKEPTAVTVELGCGVVVRARAEGDSRPTEASLPSSSVTGKKVRFATDRRLLARACALGFHTFTIAGPGQPAVGRDGPRTFVWVTLDAKDALSPHPFPVRISLDGKRQSTDGSGTAGVGWSRVRAAASAEVARTRRKVVAAAPAGGVPGLLALWSRKVGLLTGLVDEQRRRERCG